MMMLLERLFWITSVSAAASLSTYLLIHKAHVPVVRASSGLTLLFATVMMYLPMNPASTLSAAFFGATFVGMTDKSRLGWRGVLFASLLFAIIFYFLVPLFRGFGGGLGTAAFIASSLVYLIPLKR